MFLTDKIKFLKFQKRTRTLQRFKDFEFSDSQTHISENGSIGFVLFERFWYI